MTIQSHEIERKAQARAHLEAELTKSLSADERHLPSLCLWDQQGLQLFEDITHSEDYYPFAAEASLLGGNLDSILDHISEGSVILELGSGSLEKTDIVLRGLSRLQRHVNYYALDVSPSELDRTLNAIEDKLGDNSTVKCHPLMCTYEESPVWLKQNPVLYGRDVIVLWLGSSMANETPETIQRLLQAFKAASESSRIGKLTLLIGIDGCKDIARISRAYDLSNGLSRRFAMNGIANINSIMGYKLFDPKDWVFRGLWNSKQSRYETCLSPVRDIALDIGRQTIHLKSSELVRLIYSQKWDRGDMERISEGTGFGITKCWENPEVGYVLYKLE